MDLFVYGTLRCPELMTAVAGAGRQSAEDATLDGYAVLPVAGDVVPLIRQTPGGSANGLLWHQLTAEQIARLDLYEGAFGYALIDVSVVCKDGSAHLAKMYLPPDDIPVGTGNWSLEDWQAGHLHPAMLAAREVFSHHPLPSASQLRENWAMTERRAWSKYRASQAEPAPAHHRHEPSQGDVALRVDTPPVGSFFRMQSFEVDHRRFDGATEKDLRREVAVGVDAALALPYDPRSDNVLLVEQLRMGPLLRGDTNPWTLEPIAGMIDARETPQCCALRETREEAGIDVERLIDIGSGYPSPGNLTDHFYCYLALTSLPDRKTYTGGLTEEAEDLRLHVMGFETAMNLVKSGEITALPLVMMLYWLNAERVSLLEFARTSP